MNDVSALSDNWLLDQTCADNAAWLAAKNEIDDLSNLQWTYFYSVTDVPAFTPALQTYCRTAGCKVIKSIDWNANTYREALESVEKEEREPFNQQNSSKLSTSDYENVLMTYPDPEVVHWLMTRDTWNTQTLLEDDNKYKSLPQATEMACKMQPHLPTNHHFMLERPYYVSNNDDVSAEAIETELQLETDSAVTWSDVQLLYNNTPLLSRPDHLCTTLLNHFSTELASDVIMCMDGRWVRLTTELCTTWIKQHPQPCKGAQVRGKTDFYQTWYDSYVKATCNPPPIDTVNTAIENEWEAYIQKHKKEDHYALFGFTLTDGKLTVGKLHDAVLMKTKQWTALRDKFFDGSIFKLPDAETDLMTLIALRSEHTLQEVKASFCASKWDEIDWNKIADKKIGDAECSVLDTCFVVAADMQATLDRVVQRLSREIVATQRTHFDFNTKFLSEQDGKLLTLIPQLRFECTVYWNTTTKFDENNVMVPIAVGAEKEDTSNTINCLLAEWKQYSDLQAAFNRPTSAAAVCKLGHRWMNWTQTELYNRYTLVTNKQWKKETECMNELEEMYTPENIATATSLGERSPEIRRKQRIEKNKLEKKSYDSEVARSGKDASPLLAKKITELAQKKSTQLPYSNQTAYIEEHIAPKARQAVLLTLYKDLQADNDKKYKATYDKLTTEQQRAVDTQIKIKYTAPATPTVSSIDNLKQVRNFALQSEQKRSDEEYAALFARFPEEYRRHITEYVQKHEGQNGFNIARKNAIDIEWRTIDQELEKLRTELKQLKQSRFNADEIRYNNIEAIQQRKLKESDIYKKVQTEPNDALTQFKIIKFEVTSEQKRSDEEYAALLARFPEEYRRHITDYVQQHKGQGGINIARKKAIDIEQRAIDQELEKLRTELQQLKQSRSAADEIRYYNIEAIQQRKLQESDIYKKVQTEPNDALKQFKMSKFEVTLYKKNLLILQELKALDIKMETAHQKYKQNNANLVWKDTSITKTYTNERSDFTKAQGPNWIYSVDHKQQVADTLQKSYTTEIEKQEEYNYARMLERFPAESQDRIKEYVQKYENQEEKHNAQKIAIATELEVYQKAISEKQSTLTILKDRLTKKYYKDPVLHSQVQGRVDTTNNYNEIEREPDDALKRFKKAEYEINWNLQTEKIMDELETIRVNFHCARKEWALKKTKLAWTDPTLAAHYQKKRDHLLASQVKNWKYNVDIKKIVAEQMKTLYDEEIETQETHIKQWRKAVVHAFGPGTTYSNEIRDKIARKRDALIQRSNIFYSADTLVKAAQEAVEYALKK